MSRAVKIFYSLKWKKSKKKKTPTIKGLRFSSLQGPRFNPHLGETNKKVWTQT